MMKTYLTYRKRALNYLKKHPEYNATIHVFGGMSIGILIAGPFINPHPIRWGLVFAILSVAGHLYTLKAQK